MGVFDDILENVEDDDKEIFDKYPQLKETVDGLEARYSDADNRLKGWESWALKHYNYDSGKTTEQIAAERKAQEMEARARALEALKDTEMTFDEILEGLRGQGFVKRDEIPEVVKQATSGLVSREEYSNSQNQLALGFEYIYKKTAHLPSKHMKEFGDPMNMNDFMDHWQKSGIKDPDQAYESFISPLKQERDKVAAEKREKEYQDRVEAARKEGEEKARREMSMGQGGRIPSDQGGTSGMGMLERQIMQKRTQSGAQKDNPPEIPDSVKLGDGTLAQLGYEKYLKGELGADNKVQ
jgi:hypothetical protein